MIHIGNQTSFAAAEPTVPFKHALTAGFDAFEWFPDKKPGAGWDESDLPQPLRQWIREQAGARGMRLSVHARCQANPLQAESYPLLYADLDLAREIGAALLNVHLGEEAGLAAFAAAIIPLARRTAEAGILLAIENTPFHSPELFNEFFATLRSMDSAPKDHVGMCLDLGHANLCAATRNDYIGFVDRLGPAVPIIHVHLHENWGDADTHLPLFTGPSARDDTGIREFLERLKRRNFSGSIILEQWPEPPSLLNQARDRLRDLLDPKEKPGSPKQSGTTVPSQVKLEKRSPARVSANLAGHDSREGPGKRREPGITREDFGGQLAKGDARSRSWREKLEALRGLLVGESSPLSDTALVDLAIYLRLLQTGQVRCEEDGRHMRPGHHAQIALEIQDILARRTPPEQGTLLRQIYPWLPSSAGTFRTAEPLTRIRDIAHRNDIPMELKRELKHSLQNKLHRCAGPEDMRTCERLWQRITGPGGNYSAAFIEEFRLFRAELKEFFNASSLEERLATLLPRVDEDEARNIRIILDRKAGASIDEKIIVFNALTGLRAVRSVANKHNEIGDDRKVLLDDIGLEDFAFVLLSDLLNGLGATGSTNWPAWLELLRLAVRNLHLSGIQREESGALGSELHAWAATLDVTAPEQMLRLRASTGRARRLAEDYCDQFTLLFSARAHLLGQALGVGEGTVRELLEGGIRAHLVFQLSRLASELLRRLRAHLALPAWDVLVTGNVVGRLEVAEELRKPPAEWQQQVVLVLSHAGGDEEIPSGVSGVVLAHEMPHLSHLGVRARQAGVVLACCEEAEEFELLKAFEGRMVRLQATPENVTCSIDDSDATPRRPAKVLRLPSAPPGMPTESWLSIEAASTERAGGKAGGARRLAKLASAGDAGFATPPGLVIPLGVMETSLRSHPSLTHQYRQTLDGLDHASAEGVVEVSNALQRLIAKIEVPKQILAEVQARFDANDRLIIRSSANCEDLEELAGAGLYESVPNVSPRDIATAVRRVWASLWTARAILSRREIGLPNERVHMGVLVQPMVASDLAFVLHTAHPLEDRPGEAYAELAVGLGETLVSGAWPGNPYRMACDKASGEVRMLAFANFSHALRLAPEGGYVREVLDYSKIRFSTDAEYRKHTGRRLAAIADLVERTIGSAQDIEGGIVSEKVYLFQTRPQQGKRESIG